MTMNIYLPPRQDGIIDRLAEEDEEFVDALFDMAFEYSDLVTDTELAAKQAVDMFIELIEAGFYKFTAVKVGDQVRTEIRAWSPTENCYKFPQDFAPNELGIADGMQDYFTAVN